MKFIRTYLVLEKLEPSIVKASLPPFIMHACGWMNQRSRVCVALLFKKLRAMDSAQNAHARQFDDHTFHFVPRKKMMQIQVRYFFR